MNHCSIVSLLVFFMFTISSHGEENLTSTVHRLSQLARVTNGIVLQTEMSQNPKSTDIIVAELLRIGDRQLLDTLGSFPTKDLLGQLDSLTQDVAKVPQRKVPDVKALGQAIQTLDGMLPLIEKIKQGVDSTALAGLKNDYDAASRAVSYFDAWKPVEKWMEVSRSLGFVMSTKVDSTEIELMMEFKKRLQCLRTESIPFASKLPKVIVSDDLKKITALIVHLTTLDGLKAVLDVGKKYKEVKDVSSLAGSLEDLKADVKNLEGVLQKKMKNTKGDVIGKMAQKIIDSLKMDPSISETVGLPNGIQDIERMFEDLKGEWLRKSIADGKNLEKLSTALEPLKGFYGQMRTLENNWHVFLTAAKEIPSVQNLAGLLTRLEASGKTVSESSVLTTSLEGVAGCLKQLKPNTLADRTQFEKVHQQLVEFIGNVEKLLNVIEDLQKSPLYSDIDSVMRAIYPLVPQDKDLNVPAIEKAVNDIRNVSGIVEVGALINSTLEKTIGIPLSAMEAFLFVPIDWKQFEEVKSSLDDLNLIAALNCIAEKKFDSKGANAFVKFAEDVSSLNGMASEVEKTKTLFTSISGVTSSKPSVKSQKTSRPSRSAMVESSLQKLDGTIVKNLGSGVRLLQKMDRVLLKQHTVMTLADSNAAVNDIITKIPVDSWTDENRQLMRNLVEDLKKLDIFCKNLADIESSWKLFSEASSIHGAPLDTHLFEHPIAAALDSSADPNIKSIASVFREATPLQLDYSGGSDDLKQAATTFAPIRKFFDDFFEISRVQEVTSVTVVDSSMSLGMIILISSLVFLVFLGIVYFVAAFVTGSLLLWWGSGKKKRKDQEERQELLGKLQAKDKEIERVNADRKKDKEIHAEEIKDAQEKVKLLGEAVEKADAKAATAQEQLAAKHEQERIHQELYKETVKKASRATFILDQYGYNSDALEGNPDWLKTLVRNVEKGRIKNVKLTMENGCDVNARCLSKRGKYGFNYLLHIPIVQYLEAWWWRSSKIDMVRVLLIAGADPSLRNSEGRNAFSYLQDAINKINAESMQLKEKKKELSSRTRDRLEELQRMMSMVIYYEMKHADNGVWRSQRRFLEPSEAEFFVVTTEKEKVDPQYTHIVVPTIDGNVLDLDAYGELYFQLFAVCVASTQVLVSERFHEEILKNTSYMLNDYNQRIRTFKYNGKLYELVDTFKYYARCRDGLLTGFNFLTTRTATESIVAKFGGRMRLNEGEWYERGLRMWYTFVGKTVPNRHYPDRINKFYIVALDDIDDDPKGARNRKFYEDKQWDGMGEIITCREFFDWLLTTTPIPPLPESSDHVERVNMPPIPANHWDEDKVFEEYHKNRCENEKASKGGLPENKRESAPAPKKEAGEKKGDEAEKKKKKTSETTGTDEKKKKKKAKAKRGKTCDEAEVTVEQPKEATQSTVEEKPKTVNGDDANN